MLIERVRDTIIRGRMVDAGDTVLVAVSGGVDSVVLLDVLSRLQAGLGIHLTVAHFDHRLREESAADATFVENLGAKHDLEVHVGQAQPAQQKKVAGMGPEAAARHLRLDYLERLARELGARRIALAHHANDQAETVLHRLARGTGADGLAGILPSRGPYIRPLLGVTRAEILSYASEHQLAWREDATNADLRFARNRIRHRVLPELEEVHEGATQAIGRAARLLAEHREALEHLAACELDRMVLSFERRTLILDLSRLRECPSSVQSVILRAALRRLRGDLDGIERKHVVELRALVTSDMPHGELHLPRTAARIQNGTLILAAEPFTAESPWQHTLSLGRTEFAKHGFTLDLRVVEGTWRSSDQHSVFIEWADADRISFPLLLRNRRPGDRFAPLGMPETKLKDFFNSQQVTIYERDRIPLLCDQHRIIWVAGHRLSDAVRCTPSTHRMLRLQMEVLPT